MPLAIYHTLCTWAVDLMVILHRASEGTLSGGEPRNSTGLTVWDPVFRSSDG